MRVLILSAALLACASAAPSGAVIGHLPIAALPTVNPGDLQGALIDAKVQTEDYLRSIAEKQREAVEQVVDQNEKVVEAVDQAKERSLEAFWANEDKKWQALDAVQTAQAQIDGQIASSSDAVAKSLVVPTVQVTSPVVAPVPTYFYTPGFVAPGLKIAAAIPEAPKEEPKAEKPEETKTDSVQVESANVKTADAAKPETQPKYVVGQSQLLSTYPVVPTLKLVPQVQPWGSVAFVQPGLKTLSPVPYAGHVFGPTVIKTVW
ncbi:hypothetical protein ABMA28_011278 [Loxostege sticticalis]|uniref:Uncharacterized protein n=1 Tax=Loxostege sticticalis TaxID=481309 RepID=A0ABD0S6Y1_LOXSC